MHNTPVKSVRRKDFDIPEIFSRQKCMGKRRRGIPAVAADFSIHLYMHKNTNKRQHT